MDLNDPQLQLKYRDIHPLPGQSYRVISSLNETVVWPGEVTNLYFCDSRVGGGVSPLSSNPLLNLPPPCVVCGWQSNDGLLGIANQALVPGHRLHHLPRQAEGGLSCIEPPLEPNGRPIYIYLLSTSCQKNLTVGCSICTHCGSG